MKRKPHEIIFIPDKKNLPALRLRSSVPLKIENGAAVAEFKLRAEQTASFVLEEADGESPSANPDYVSEAFKETMNFWLALGGAFEISRTLARNGQPLRADAEAS